MYMTFEKIMSCMYIDSVSVKKNTIPENINLCFSDMTKLFLYMKSNWGSVCHIHYYKKIDSLNNDSHPSEALSDYSEEERTVLLQIDFIKYQIYKLCNKNSEGKSKQIIDFVANDDKKLLDTRLLLACEYLIDCVSNDYISFEAFEKYEILFQKCLEITLKSKALNESDLYVFVFMCQILNCVLESYFEKEYTQITNIETFSYFAYFITNYMYSVGDRKSKESLYFAKNSLDVRVPNHRYNAFLNLILISMHTMNYQLAYDACESWIKMDAVGDFCKTINKNLVWSKNELEWREFEGESFLAQMFGMYSYVCASIEDTYEMDPYQWNTFHEFARDYIDKAIKMDPTEGLYYCNYGTMLREDAAYNFQIRNNIEQSIYCIGESIKRYKTYINISMGGDDFSEKLCSFRCYCDALMDMVFYKVLSKEDFQDDDYPKIPLYL